MEKLRVEYINIEDLKAYERNARTHSDEQIEQLCDSIREFGFTNPVLIDELGELIAGHGRTEAAKRLGMKSVPAIRLSNLSPEQIKALRIADNQLALNAGWDEELLRTELAELKDFDFNLAIVGFSDEELDLLLTSEEVQTDSEEANDERSEAVGRLADRFIVPPFSVLNTMSPDWINRSREWNELIGDNGESREGKLFQNVIMGKKEFKGVSILNPTLAEIINHWFLPNDDGEALKTFDPFAGDTVFGYVSAYMGNDFTGIELREEQAALNNERTAQLSARYINDDGQNIRKHLEKESQDLMFSCPPYFDLEKYSDLPNDASNQDYQGFISILRNAFLGGLEALKPNRFAVIVMSNVRDDDGFYHDICSDITKIMAEGGAKLYNEIVLMNSPGTAAVRANRYMRHRKVARVHQEVLVYFKGDPKTIKEGFPIFDPTYVEEGGEDE